MAGVTQQKQMACLRTDGGVLEMLLILFQVKLEVTGLVKQREVTHTKT